MKPRWWGSTPSRLTFDGKRSLVWRAGDKARLYSSSSCDIESFDIKCGSSGHTTVDIYNSHQLTSPTRPLIIYLPPTGVHLRHTHPSIPSILHSHPLAAINYRWNHLPTPPKPISTPSAFSTIPTSHPFPTPLHDTLHAFTWLANQYLPSKSSPPSSTLPEAYPTPPPSPGARSRSPYASDPPRSKPPPRPLILYGSHLGGTLAASLALTECKSSKNVPFPIAGLIVRDGVFDWTFIATSLPTSQPSSQYDSTIPTPTPPDSKTSQPWTTQALHTLKITLFTHPASTFDPFASPHLFFRTPTIAVPRLPFFPGHEPPSSPLDDVSGLSLSEAEYTALRSAEFDGLSASPGEGKAQEEQEAETVRSSNVKFPPKDSGLKIPRSLFVASGVGKDGDVEDEGRVAQAEEMTRLMRRSVVMHEFKDRVMWDEDADPHGASEERVQFISVGGGSGEGGLLEEEEERVIREWLEGGGFDCEEVSS